ncbi:GNAT family N-acetyltransferase [Macrococcoides caseolyticum]|uniref:GNAT family N-acetyltransferase n=1 Tax=Macrococcoides caseolyticum TaxID=69966 RepID=UPI000C344620|nr:GNAT family N-acetyltransferase [Macrococcus caseolyticus]PKE06083.1 GNAT family N-acetyltransferase [Macrococcus caseolyticus]PKE23258.1 GNAT family N-acetyltransferase [Macrococcus caseolyticus]PKE64645.1 GNAT family N-acetyltransferase [Macrococcus caseolyticus]
MNTNYLNYMTNRLVIRPLTNSDYESWLKSFLNRKPSKHKYDDGLIDMSICTEVWFQELVEKHQALINNDDTYILAIFDKSGQHVGMINVVTIRRGNFQWGECGYFIHNQFWRNGYAYEAMKKALFIANKVLKFHRIEAHVNLDNIPSIKLLEKLGFEHECIRKNFIYEFEQWTDNHVYYINFDDNIN